MKSELTKIYKGSFFARRRSLAWRVPIVVNAISSAVSFNSVIDLGCGNGDLVKGFLDMGKVAFGIEGSREAKEYLACSRSVVLFRDLREPITVWAKYDLALSLEVAEHIEEEYAEQYVKNLTSFSEQVLFSAAPPGQRGHGHVNCQPIEYWDYIFAAKGFQRYDNVAEEVKHGWRHYKHKPGIKAYEQNLHYYFNYVI